MKAFDYRERLKLCGEFHASLNSAEANAWTEFLHKHPAYHRLRETEALKNNAMSCGSSEEMVLRSVREHDAALCAMYEVAKQWVAENIKDEDA